MTIMNRQQLTCGLLSSILVLAVGCQPTTCGTKCAATSTAAPAATAPAAPVVAAPATPTPVAPPTASLKIVRIKAGASAPVTDSAGNVWLADQGFDGGDVAERPDAEIANTKDPMLYRAEHYSMDSFSWPVPNGKYQVKLHFCETYDGITGPGERVFSLNVQGHDYKDFDVWKQAGGPLKAYVETVNDVEVTEGKLLIKFTSNVENPQINAIEIIPAS